MVDTSLFRDWLKARRKALDLTQDELALLIGCTGESIRKIEAGAQRPSKQIAERLADRLEIPVGERGEFVRLARAIPTERDRHEDDGRRVKGYYLREQIGAGGYGAVFRAYQVAVQRDVAIKMIASHYANQPEFIRRFEYEAQLVARLEHPHIVPLFDYWRDRSGAYLVMRWMRGGNLQTLLQRGPLPFDAAFHLLAQIIAGLTTAHRQGIVHRDLKPANLLLDEGGNVYLADFGIAKDAQHPARAVPDGVGRLSSSPAYSAPEQLRGEPVTPRTDIYSLGILLYEMLAGGHPFHAATPTEQIDSHLREEVPPLTTRRPDLPASVDTLLAKATAKNPMLRYADVMSLLDDARRIVVPGRAVHRVASLDRDQLQGGMPEMAETADVMLGAPSLMYAEAIAARVENPYKGLRAFQEADAPDFFGREALVQHLVTRLAEPSTLQRFLGVVGPSGSGKSSLVRAGLVPALRQGILPGAGRWFVVTMLPGAHPLDALEAALLQVAVDPSASVMEQLEQDEHGLSCAITRILPDDAATELVLVVDQFEEVFTLVEDEAERLHFLNSLVAAVSEPHSRLWVIITLRADFFDRPLLYPTFGEVIRQRTAPVVALSPDELRRAIVGPAARAGLNLEPGLVTAIVTEVGAQPGALPLLQYALTELVERRDGRTLTLAAYRASGGVPGALARRADELFAGLTTPEQRATHRLFLRLVALGEGSENTRRRVRRSEVASLADGPQIDTVLETYARHRLLTFDHDAETREPTVELAHEALLHAWSRLRHWLIEDREGLRLQRRLTDAAQVWAATNHEQGSCCVARR
ncbi:MAG: protein kinase [Chloroflexota bacterium]|nr:protein kinase [Chloroflexota bacterium]